MAKARVFKAAKADGTEVTLKFISPTQKQNSKANLVQKAEFSRALRAEVLTSAEVEKLLRDRGLWGEEQEAKLNVLNEKLRELTDQLDDDTLSNEDGEKLCVRIEDLRAEIAQINDIHQTIAPNTCELMAEEARIKYLATVCVVDAKTNRPVYKDVDHFDDLMDSEPQMTVSAYTETMVGLMSLSFDRDLPTDLSSSLPENEWRSKRGLLEDTEDQEDGQEDEEDAKTA